MAAYVSTKEYSCPSLARKGKLMSHTASGSRKAVDAYINGRHSGAYKAYTLLA